MRAVGMDYDRALFGIKLSDCRSLARCLEFCETLVVLDLRGALLDDDKLRMLASGLINNVSVVHLDLSANRIADRGVRALAKLLNPNSILQVVDLSNNKVCRRPPCASVHRTRSVTDQRRRARELRMASSASRLAPPCRDDMEQEVTGKSANCATVLLEVGLIWLQLLRGLPPRRLDAFCMPHFLLTCGDSAPGPRCHLAKT